MIDFKTILKGTNQITHIIPNVSQKPNEGSKMSIVYDFNNNSLYTVNNTTNTITKNN